ncbi:MAG: ABC transporter ATP-binding protein [Firmicutes bacterium]|nr:ABC transporter ATP-binding protein [Bacillota bacterium]
MQLSASEVYASPDPARMRLWRCRSGPYAQSKHGRSGRWAIEDVNHIFYPGITAVVGPNGSGKTTLLRTLATSLAPARGSVHFMGRRVDSAGASSADVRWYRSRLGYLPQSSGVYPNLSPRRFVRYIAELKALPAEDLEMHVNRALVDCGLQSCCGIPLSQCSEGERRRTVLAAAVVGSPEVIVLDEPMRSCDPVQRLGIRNMLRLQAERRNAICILSAPAISDLDGVCDELIVMDNGRVAFAGDPEDLRKAARGGVLFRLLEADECDRVIDALRSPLPSSRQPVVSSVLKRSGGQVAVRVVVDHSSALAEENRENWVEVEPTLEEAYLWFRTFRRHPS